MTLALAFALAVEEARGLEVEAAEAVAGEAVAVAEEEAVTTLKKEFPVPSRTSGLLPALSLSVGIALSAPSVRRVLLVAIPAPVPAPAPAPAPADLSLSAPDLRCGPDGPDEPSAALPGGAISALPLYS